MHPQTKQLLLNAVANERDNGGDPVSIARVCQWPVGLIIYHGRSPRERLVNHAPNGVTALRMLSDFELTYSSEDFEYHLCSAMDTVCRDLRVVEGGQS